MSEEFSRWADSLATGIEQHGRELRDRITSFSDALEGFSDRVSRVISGLTSGDSDASPTPSAGTTGIQLVRVVNAQDQPVPVRLAEATQSRRSGGGFFANLMGGIGGLFGGFIGGLFGGGGIALAVAVGELAVALGLAIPLVHQARELVADVRSFAGVLASAVQRLVALLFDRLRAAGLIPVSHLIASLLLLIDRGIVLVLTHVQPLIQWVGQLLGALTQWLGRFVSSLGRWLGEVLSGLGPYLGRLVGFLLETVVRPALRVIFATDVLEGVRGVLRDLVQVVVGAIAGGALAVGNVLMETFRWAGDWLAHSIARVIDALPGVSISVSPPRPLGERIARTVQRSLREGQIVGQAIAEAFVPSATPGRPGQTVGPTEAPTWTMPRFRSSALRVPEVPEPQTALEGLLEAPERPRTPAPGEPTPARPATPAARPRAEERSEVTVNGGIHIEILAESIDRENAGETARLLADRLTEELRRLTEMDRFRRGLSTTSIA